LSGIIDDTFEPFEAPYFSEKLNSTSFDKSIYQKALQADSLKLSNYAKTIHMIINQKSLRFQIVIISIHLRLLHIKILD